MTPWDVLIVGAGAAGCILAARLSEDPRCRVLLVEAGIDTPPEAVPADISDAYPVSYANPAYFWPGLTATARPGSAAAPFGQACVMGGGSSVMGMWALRGMPGDYDAWRNAGAAGWGWSDVLPAFRRLERDLDVAGPLHGDSGPISIQRNPVERWPAFVRALATAAEGRGLPLRSDLNGDFADGVFAVPATSDAFGRASAARGYLTTEVRKRNNLSIETDALVTRLVFANRRVNGVELRRANLVNTIPAREVVLSAGAIHSPALLMRSGIGPAGDLAALGIAPVADLPGVGAHLQNHPLVMLATVIAPHARQSPALRSYPMACARASSFHPGAPPGDLHLQFVARTSANSHGTRFGVIGAALYSPVSRGRVSLVHASPNVPPRVDFNLLSEGSDRAQLGAAVRLVLKIADDPAVATLRGPLFVPRESSLIRRLSRPGLGVQLASMAVAALLDSPLRGMAVRRAGTLVFPRRDDRLIDQLLDRVSPMFHPTGSCRMGRADDPSAVVDPLCRVRGVAGLRIVDASIMPVIPRANTCLPAMMIAEHAAATTFGDRANVLP